MAFRDEFALQLYRIIAVKKGGCLNVHMGISSNRYLANRAIAVRGAGLCADHGAWRGFRGAWRWAEII